MAYLELLDNTQTDFCPSDLGIDEGAFCSFVSMSNISLERLCNENPGLAVMTTHFNELKEDNLINLYGMNVNENVHAQTGNLMGFVGRGDFSLSIRSRFYLHNPASDDKTDYFLHYMLMKVYSINLFDLPFGLESNGNLNILMYLFPCYLKRALAQGIYKTYCVRHMNDSRPRGVIDVPRHIRENIPFKGSISYTMRETSYDNDITQLIRHTIEYMKGDPVGKVLLNQNREIIDAVNLITQVTGSYGKNRRRNVVNSCLKPFAHPYFTKYRELIKLCIMILRHDKACYGLDKDKTYGILFDGAWLWEEYLATILKEIGFKHPQNKLGKDGIHVHRNNIYYPDFYYGRQIPVATEIPVDNLIVDAKYKHLERGIERNDLNQMITYLHILPARKACLLYPYQCSLDNLIIGEEKKIYGLGGYVRTIGFPIPENAGSMKEFFNLMKTRENRVKEYFRNIINNPI